MSALPSLVCCAGLASFALATLGCSSTDGGAANGNRPSNVFVPATPPANACSLLTVSEIGAAIADPLPGRPGSEITNEDAFSRDCFWSNAAGQSIDLSVVGALTAVGAQSLLGEPGTNRGNTREEVSGLGDAAAYFQNDDINYRGVEAISGSYVVEVSTTRVEQPPPKETFISLVRQVIARLH